MVYKFKIDNTIEKIITYKCPYMNSVTINGDEVELDCCHQTLPSVSKPNKNGVRIKYPHICHLTEDIEIPESLTRVNKVSL